ncbi:MAG: TonB-dependent receptor domain-containing protein, partial [Giesbergeria sp.]
VLSVGLGAQPTERLNLFAYANHFDLDLRAQNLFRSSLDRTQTQGALGFSYRWHPTAQTWVKLGRSQDDSLLKNFPAFFTLEPLSGILGMGANPRKQFNDLQVRHTFDPQPGTRWSATLEHVAEKQFNQVLAEGLISASTPGGDLLYADPLVFGGANVIDRRYTAFTLAGSHRYNPTLSLDAAMGWQQVRHRVVGANVYALDLLGQVDGDIAQRHDTERVFTPRAGLVLQPAPGHTLRLAYQDWMRPLSTSTLAGIETAGIPVEDQLLEAGGRHKRTVLQWSHEWGASTFVKLRADHLRLSNPGTIGVDLRTPSLPFLEELRNAQLTNLSSTDLLEDTPSYEGGTLKVLAGSVNHMFSRQWSGYAKYLYQHSQSA